MNFVKTAFSHIHVSAVIFSHYFNMLHFELRKDEIFTNGISDSPIEYCIVSEKTPVVEFNWTSLFTVLFLLANSTSIEFPMSSWLTAVPPFEIISASSEITPFSRIFPVGLVHILAIAKPLFTDQLTFPFWKGRESMAFWGSWRLAIQVEQSWYLLRPFGMSYWKWMFWFT